MELGPFNVYCKAREDFELGKHHYVSLQGCTWVLFTGLVYSHWIVKFCLPFWDAEFPEVRFEWKTSSKISCHVFHYSPTCFKYHRSMVAFRFCWDGDVWKSAGWLFCFLVCTVFLVLFGEAFHFYEFFTAKEDMSRLFHLISFQIRKSPVICRTERWGLPPWKAPWRLELKEEDHDQDLIPTDWPGVIGVSSCWWNVLGEMMKCRGILATPPELPPRNKGLLRFAKAFCPIKRNLVFNTPY